MKIYLKKYGDNFDVIEVVVEVDNKHKQTHQHTQVNYERILFEIAQNLIAR